MPSLRRLTDRCECSHAEHVDPCHRSPRLGRRVCSTCAQDHALERAAWRDVIARRRELVDG